MQHQGPENVSTNAAPSKHWAQHAIFWHLYPLGFVGAVGAEAQHPGSPQLVHRLGHIEAWLDYAIELGCSAVMLGPIFEAQTHGYDTLDHLKIDPRLGDDHDFDRLVNAVHKRGMQLVLDGVFNHVGRDFPRLRDVVTHGDASAYARWFRRKGPGPEDFATFEGHAALVALNHDEPEVATYVRDVMLHWLGRGADGYRLDAAYAVPSRFWQRVLPEVRQAHPRAWFVGEVIHGDYVQYIEQSGLDSVTQYELWKAIWSAINDKNFFELAWSLERHSGFVARFSPQTFVGNHDVTRIASRIQDERHLRHALVALFTLPGVPSVYAGDEQAFRGVKEERVGGDDAIRPAFPGDPSQLLPYGWPTYRLHQSLISLRRRHAWLQSAQVSVETRTNETLVYRCHRDGQALCVALNLGDKPCVLAGRAQLLLSDGAQPGETRDSVTVAAHGFSVFQRSS